MRHRARNRAPVAALALAVAAVVLPPGVRAQGDPSGEPSLDRVEEALDAGRLEEARRQLESWQAAEPSAREGDRLRGWFLAARLTSDPDSSETLYLRVALAGDMRYGDRAWLRLAQLHLARETPARASRDLERLRTDFPGSSLVSESWWWTGVAAREEGDPGRSCDALRRAVEASRSAGEVPDAAAAAAGALGECGIDASGLEIPAARVVAGRDGEAAAGATAAAPSHRAPDAGAPGPASGWTVQLGAFSQVARARTVRDRAREEGFPVTITGPDPRDGLYRVRTAVVAGRSAADDLAGRLEARGLPAYVVEVGG